jgi:hypothetical protein
MLLEAAGRVERVDAQYIPAGQVGFRRPLRTRSSLTSVVTAACFVRCKLAAARAQ